jgi:hypothetical protein
MVERARAAMVFGADGVGRNSDAKGEGEANRKGDALRWQTDEDSLDAESQAKAMRIAGYCAACVLVPRAVSLVLVPLDIDLPSIFPHPAACACPRLGCCDVDGLLRCAHAINDGR